VLAQNKVLNDLSERNDLQETLNQPKLKKFRADYLKTMAMLKLNALFRKW
jgi:hypothetical protein